MKVPSVHFDAEQAMRFLTALLPEGPGDMFIEFRFLHHNGKPPQQSFVTHLEKIPWDKVAAANARGWSVTVGPGLRCRKGGTKEDVGKLAALWADVDGREFDGDKREALRSVWTLPRERHPSAIVDSGNGVHAWWWLDRPIPVTDENREDLEAILRGLQRAIGSDAVHDLSRVMRLPGSLNVKNPEAPLPCRFVSLSADRRFPLEAFTHLAVGGAAPDPAEKVRFAAVPPTVKLRDLRLSARIKDLIKTGRRNDGEYRTRSEADQAVITSMRQAGHSPDEIRAVFLNPKWGISVKYRELAQQDHAAADRYLGRSIAHADAFLAAERAKEGPGILFVPSTSPPDLKKVQAVVLDAFPELWPATQTAMATPASMIPDDVLNPSALIFEGPSAGGKTTVIDFVDGTPYLGYRTDKFTPRAFVSHAANVPGTLLADVDLLPRIRHRCMLTGELSPLFRGREEDLVENFAILTAVLDGRGLQTDSGSRGRRGYTGDYLFSWIGATTPLPTRTWRLMQQLGARLLFYWMHLPVPEEDEIVANLTGERSYRERLAACRAAVNEFLLALFRAHARKGQERPFGITWNRRADQDVAKQIARLAQVGAEARGVVSVWQDDQGQINFHPPNVEQPHRLAALLYNLARGHALLHGRSQLTGEDLLLVSRVALDSMPLERRKVLRLLITTEPGLLRSSDEVKEALGCSKPTALRIMREMGLLGVADVQTDPSDREEGGRPGLTIALPERLTWLVEPAVRVALDLPTKDGYWEPGVDGQS